MGASEEGKNATWYFKEPLEQLEVIKRNPSNLPYFSKTRTKPLLAADCFFALLEVG